MPKEEVTNIKFSIAVQIIIPTLVAVIVGLFSYKAGIDGVKLSNETNLIIAQKNYDAIIKSIEKSNENNTEIAGRNNIALKDSVEVTNKYNQDINANNFKNEIAKLKKEFELDKASKTEEREKEKQNIINSILIDIASNLTILNNIDFRLQQYKTTYLNQEFETIEQLVNFVLIVRNDAIISEIHNSIQVTSHELILNKLNGLPIEFSSYILTFYKELETIYKITNIPFYRDHVLLPDEFNNHSLSDFWTSSSSKASYCSAELSTRNLEIIKIYYHIDSALLSGAKILESMFKSQNLDSKMYTTLINRLSDRQRTNNYYSIIPKLVEEKIKKLSE